MISLHLNPEEPFVEVHVSGRLEKQDYEQVVPQLESLLNGGRSFPFLVLLHDFKGWQPAALAREIALDAKYRSQFGRTAVVGDGKLTEWASAVSNLFFPSEIRFFSPAQEHEARAWLRASPRTSVT